MTFDTQNNALREGCKMFCQFLSSRFHCWLLEGMGGQLLWPVGCLGSLQPGLMTSEAFQNRCSVDGSLVSLSRTLRCAILHLVAGVSCFLRNQQSIHNACTVLGWHQQLQGLSGLSITSICCCHYFLLELSLQSSSPLDVVVELEVLVCVSSVASVQERLCALFTILKVSVM